MVRRWWGRVLLWHAGRRMFWTVQMTARRRIVLAARANNTNRWNPDRVFWQRASAAVAWAMCQDKQYEDALMVARYAASPQCCDEPSIALAYAYQALAIALGSNGLLEECEVAAADAARHFREHLPAGGSSRDWHYFAETLELRSKALRELVRHAEALDPAREAVAACAQLRFSWARIDVRSLMLANLAIGLSTAGHHVEALAMAAEPRELLDLLVRFRRRGPVRSRGLLLTHTGLSRLALGDTAAAAEDFAQAVADLGRVPGWEEERHFAASQLAALNGRPHQ